MDTRELRQVAYQHPDAQRLVTEVQQEYVHRYGGPDGTPVDHDEFSPPQGLFVVAYTAGKPVAMGGWRWLDVTHGPFEQFGAVAELKRMFVTAASRGRGHARSVLSFLQDSALDAGAEWLVLETGLKQPEAITLYRACGYLPVPAFGHYADDALSVHLGKKLTGSDPAGSAQ